MKMKYFYFILTLSLLSSSCTTYKASVKRQDKLQYDVIRVYPEWKYVEPKGKKWITPVIGLGAGAVYGYNNETTLDDETYSGVESAGLWAAGGLLAGVIINGVLFPKKNRQRTKFHISQTERWLSDFNNSTGRNYIVKDTEQNNTLVLVPRDKVEALRQQYRILLSKLKEANPSVTFSSLQDWKYQLKGKFSILPQSEINKISSAISQNEQRIADRDLLNKAGALAALSNEYASIQPVTKFKDSNRGLYSAASLNARQNTNRIVEEKLSKIIDSTLKKEQITLNQIQTSLSGISEFDSFYRRFDNKYQHLRAQSQVQRFYNAIIVKKTAVVAQFANEIRESIRGANSIARLSHVEVQYLSNLAVEDLVVKSLSNEIAKRRKEIYEEERQREIAEANRIKREKEKRIRILNSMPLEAQGQYLNELDFSAKGLSNAIILENIYQGSFEKIPYDREETEFSILFDAYVNAYATYCASNLPPNKIELTTKECATERVTRNGWGIETGRECISWVTIGTGLYASPKMHHAKTVVDQQQAGDMLGKIWDLFTNRDPVASVLGMAEKAQAAKADMRVLIKMNGCNSPGIRRFEENLRLFALNKQAIRLGRKNISESSTAIYSKHNNYAILAEDLIYTQSRKWRINRYQRGSGHDVSIVSKDAFGRPTELRANYHFLNFNGRRSRGSVRITFNAGLPECLYFSDFPNSCKTADRKIVSDYANGRYQR